MADFTLPKDARLILNKEQIEQKIKRIAYEIYEDNYEQKHLILAGVEGPGYNIAESLIAHLELISGFKRDYENLSLISVSLDKSHPKREGLEIRGLPEQLNDSSLIIVDDVLNTGKTLAYCLPPLLEKGPTKIEIAVLVNRSHKLFPIEVNYTGYELATTIQDHIYVMLDANNKLAYLQ